MECFWVCLTVWRKMEELLSGLFPGQGAARSMAVSSHTQSGAPLVFCHNLQCACLALQHGLIN